MSRGIPHPSRGRTNDQSRAREEAVGIRCKGRARTECDSQPFRVGLMSPFDDPFPSCAHPSLTVGALIVFFDGFHFPG